MPFTKTIHFYKILEISRHVWSTLDASWQNSLYKLRLKSIRFRIDTMHTVHSLIHVRALSLIGKQWIVRIFSCAASSVVNWQPILNPLFIRDKWRFIIVGYTQEGELHILLTCTLYVQQSRFVLTLEDYWFPNNISGWYNLHFMSTIQQPKMKRIKPIGKRDDK